jgi:hypothetical protein
MGGSYKPPSRYYLLAALAIAVVIWMVMGAPAHDGSSVPTELARSLVGK